MSLRDLRDRCAVVGIGETEYSKNSGRSVTELNLLASKLAAEDAGIKLNEIDGIIVPANVTSTAEDLCSNIGIEDLKFSSCIHMGGAGVVASIQSAILAVEAGIAATVLISFGYNGYSEMRLGRRPPPPQAGDAPSLRRNYEGIYGVITPAHLYSFWFTRYMHEAGWKDTVPLAHIAVTQRQHAILNGKAMMKKPITIEDHQKSRMIAYPFRLLDCGLETDGAAAFIITSAERAKSLKQPPVYIMGAAEGHPKWPDQTFTRPDFLNWGHRLAAPRVFQMAGITPKDVDFAEIYEGFSFYVILQLEELEFCQRLQGGEFVRDGRIALGGELPVNTHGGNLSHAHMWGATHVVEAVRQLRGTAGAAQVKDAEIGLVTGAGDLGDGSVLILRRK